MKKSLIILSVLLIAAPAWAQWTEPVRISEPGGCQYPQILAQGDTLHVVFMHWSEGRGIGYVRSTDTGNAWNTERELTDTLNTEAPQFPRIIFYGNRLLALWKAYFVQGVNRLNIGYSISTNNGLTWSEPSYILDSNWGHILHFGASGNGPFINVVLNSRINHQLIFFNIRSTDFGQTWSQPEEIFRAEQESWVDQTSYGSMVYFAWGGYFNSQEVGDVYYIKSTDEGISWSQNSMLSDNDQYPSQLPSLCVNDSGDVAACWWDFKYSPYGTTGDILIRTSSDDGITWSTENRITEESRANWSDNTWTDNNISVVWQDRRFGNITVFYASSPDSIQDWSHKIRLEDDPAESEDPVVASSNGNVYVVWADDRCDPDTDICGGIYFTRLDNQVGNKEDEEIALPDKLSLNIYPNPFNSNTIITYKDLKGGEIEIYNINGQKVRTFETTQIKEGQIEWDARDALGNKVSSGIYFARARGGGNNATIKLVYLK